MDADPSWPACGGSRERPVRLRVRWALRYVRPRIRRQTVTNGTDGTADDDSRVLFAHPADVAYADQTAAQLLCRVIRLRDLVPIGRMYLVRESFASGIRYGFELEQLADRVLRVGART